MLTLPLPVLSGFCTATLHGQPVPTYVHLCTAAWHNRWEALFSYNFKFHSPCQHHSHSTYATVHKGVASFGIGAARRSHRQRVAMLLSS